MTKRIQGRDPELVLGVLEDCLRSVSNEIVRRGSQITLLGLGPSPRAINRRDTTVIDVNSEDGVCIINADVQFQASAILGMTQQDAVVKEKLQRVFDDMLARLGDSCAESASGSGDGAAAVEPEMVAQQESAAAPAGEQAQYDAVTADEAVVVPDAVPAPVVEPPVEADPEPAQPEGIAEPVLELAREAEAPDPMVGESAHEEATAVAAEETGSSGTPGNHAREPVPAPEVNEGKEEKEAPEEKYAQEEEQAQASGAVPAPEVKQADVMAAGNVAKVDAGANASDVAPPSSPESAKPAPASTAVRVPKAEEPVKVSKPAVDESRPPVKKFEAVTLSALKAPSQQHSPSPAAETKPVFSKIARGVAAPVSPMPPTPGDEMFGVSSFEQEPEKNSKWLKWSAWLAALIVLVVAPLVWLYMPSHSGSAAPPVSQPASASASAPAAPAESVVPAMKQPGEDPDPAVVVQDWETAMNSRDAAAQAAFYADPVDRYFLRHNLNRAEVKADKQSAIDRRKGDWAVRMENVTVTRPDDHTARARLVKHYIVKEDGKTVSEWFVPSVLQMTRTNGRWQITSERDLGWATSLDELGY